MGQYVGSPDHLVPTVIQNTLHPLSTSSIIARHLLDFMVQGKITEAGAPTIRLGATPSGLFVPPHLHYHPFQTLPFLPQPSQFILAWYRHQIMQCAYRGLGSYPPLCSVIVNQHCHLLRGYGFFVCEKFLHITKSSQSCAACCV